MGGDGGRWGEMGGRWGEMHTDSQEIVMRIVEIIIASLPVASAIDFSCHLIDKHKPIEVQHQSV